MRKSIFLTLIMLTVLALAASAFAAPPFTVKQRIVYDGYLQQSGTGPFSVLADTLFVVNNANAVQLPAWIEVYEKHGLLIAEGPLFNGGDPISSIAPNGFGWITLGMVVNNPTHDPWGFAGGQKFVVKISTGPGDPGAIKPTIVEVKQVIYTVSQQYPGEAIWQAGLIKTWAEAALGGLRGPGLVKAPAW